LKGSGDVITAHIISGDAQTNETKKQGKAILGPASYAWSTKSVTRSTWG